MAVIPTLPMSGAQMRTALADINTEVGGKAASAHSHAMDDVTGLAAALADKAAASSVLTTEQLQDLVAAMFQGGAHTNATVTYDDAAGTISVTASGGGGGGLTQEQVEDMVGALVQVQGTGISVIYDDAGNALRIGLAGESYTAADKNKLAAIAAGATANATDAALRDRSSHTGTQAIGSVSGLQEALDAKAAASAAVTSTDVRTIVRITQAAYDALAVKDPATLYVVS